MKKLFRQTMLKQLQSNFDKLQVLINLTTPKDGWIKTIRTALGMTSYQLAKRMGCSQANIIAAEQRERGGRITLEKLEEIAQSMHCRCVYAFVPEKPIAKILEDQAQAIAQKRLAATRHSMKLEQQEVSDKHLSSQEEAIVNDLLNEHPDQLWED